LINENILVECFRTSSSFLNHRISPLARKYEPPRLSLFVDFGTPRTVPGASPWLTPPRRPSLWRPAWKTVPRWGVFDDHPSNHPHLHMTPAYRFFKAVDSPTSWARRGCWIPPERGTPHSRTYLQLTGSEPPLAEPSGTNWAAETLGCTGDDDYHMVISPHRGGGPRTDQARVVFESCLSHANRIQGH